MSVLDNEKFKKVYEISKEGVKLMSDLGIGVLFGAFTQTFMPEVAIPTKAAVWLGTKIFTGFVTDKTDDYIDKTAEEVVQIVDETIEQAKEEANGNRENGVVCADNQV